MKEAATDKAKEKVPGMKAISGLVLVIDDEPAVLKMLRTLLTQANYQVFTAESGEEGLRLLANGHFDCVITDAVMPKVSGYDLVQAIRRHPSYVELPIIMLTRKRHRLDVKKALEVGVTDYVLKPVDEHLLLDKVEQSVRKGKGKKHIFELSMMGAVSKCDMLLGARISMMSENGLTLRTFVPLWAGCDDAGFRIMAPMFDEIGIEAPYLRFLSTQEAPSVTAEDKGMRYETKFGFMGAPETDLKRIRNWLQKEAIKRRK